MVKYPEIILTSKELKSNKYDLINYGCELLREKLPDIGYGGKETGRIISEWLGESKKYIESNISIELLCIDWFTIED